MMNFEPTDRTRVRQLPQRAAYDRETVYAILDEAMVCHVGFVDANQPFVLPMNYARDDDRLLLHASPRSRLVRRLLDGSWVCVTVTLVDGLVVGRSAAHLSMNYRSVMIFGRAGELTEPAEKQAAFRALVEHALPGYWSECTPPSDAESDATAILAIPLIEASAKIRSGPPTNDDPPNAAGWAGEIPLRTAALTPVPTPQSRQVERIPPSVAQRTRTGWFALNR